MEGECDWKEHGQRKDLPREAVSALRHTYLHAPSLSFCGSITALLRLQDELVQR